MPPDVTRHATPTPKRRKIARALTVDTAVVRQPRPAACDRWRPSIGTTATERAGRWPQHTTEDRPAPKVSHRSRCGVSSAPEKPSPTPPANRHRGEDGGQAAVREGGRGRNGWWARLCAASRARPSPTAGAITPGPLPTLRVRWCEVSADGLPAREEPEAILAAGASRGPRHYVNPARPPINCGPALAGSRAATPTPAAPAASTPHAAGRRCSRIRERSARAGRRNGPHRKVLKG
jgi:hypothetical protein